MTIQLHIQAETGDALLANLASLAGKGLGAVDTEVLIEELRSRMARKNHVVNIEPVPANDAAVEAALDKPKRGRPTEAERARRAAAAGGENSPTEKQEPKQEPKQDTGMTGGAPTRDDVIAALNAYSEKRGGQTAGRQKMQEVCGATRLQDVKPEDYGKLVDALRVA